MKTAMPKIIANEKLRRRLCDDILKRQLSHAYIIEGVTGTGRHLLAKSIAMSLACLNKDQEELPLPCHTCENCRKIEAGICPDVITVTRDEDKTNVGIDAARFIKSDIITFPNDLDYKIYIIDEADRMTVQAQNALLLTLEEPPAYAVILLICNKADSLLETIRSRAPILRTEPVDDDLVEEHLLNTSPFSSEARALKSRSANDFREIIIASGGGIGRAYELFDPENRSSLLERRGQVRQFIEQVLSGNKGSSVLEFVFGFSQKRDELAELLDTVKLALRDLIILKKSESASLCFFADREYALDLSSMKSTTYLLKFFEECEKAINALKRNANVKLTMTEFSTNL